MASKVDTTRKLETSINPQHTNGRLTKGQYRKTLIANKRLDEEIKRGKDFVMTKKKEQEMVLHPLQKEKELRTLTDSYMHSQILNDFGIPEERQKQIREKMEQDEKLMSLELKNDKWVSEQKY